MENHSQRKHSKWGMSVGHRYAACPGSVRLCENIPETESVYAREGTQAHELLETELRNAFIQGVGHELQELRKKAPEDMHHAVGVALDYVRDVLDEYPDAILSLETKFEIPSEVAPGEVFGTNDICIYVPSLRLLYVVDYKHGVGVFVDVRGNFQLRGYGVGALSAHPEWIVDTVVLVIIQPRYPNAAPIREEWVSVLDLVEFHFEMDAAILATMQPDAPLVPGEKQCQFCPAAPTCPAREKQALAVLGETFSDIRTVTKDALPQVVEMTPDRVAYVLAMADLVEDWFKQVRARGFEMVQRGVPIPGFKLVEAQARRSFDLPHPEDEEWSVAQVAEALSKITDGRLGMEKFRRHKLVGITEAEKLLKDDAREHAAAGQKKKAVELVVEKFAFLTTKKSSGNLSLVSDSDPRPAFDTKAIAFADVRGVPLAPE